MQQTNAQIQGYNQQQQYQNQFAQPQLHPGQQNHPQIQYNAPMNNQ